MPQLLEMLHLPQEHSVPEVDIRSGRVKTGFDSQRFIFYSGSFQLFD